MATESKAKAQKTTTQPEGEGSVQSQTAEKQGSTVTQDAAVDESRKAVRFIVPWKRYSRDDIAAFPAEQAEELVARGAAEWPDKKHRKAASEDENTHETDIG
ncbi:hypothetical protein QB94_13100 [Salmonella enterica subsp. enterica serovar Newport]|nr:hypothetical protein [Salmonella enterica subsp. enterica serovar Newport]